MKEDFRSAYHRIQQLLFKEQISDAFLKMNPYIKRSRQNDIKLSFENLSNTYRFWLDYKFKKINDPESSKILSDIQKQLLELTDKLADEFYLIPELQLMPFPKETINKISDMSSGKLEDELKLFLASSKNEEDRDRKASLSSLFNLIWLYGGFTQNEKNAIEKIVTGKKVSGNEKCVLVSALTISLLRRFDTQKIRLLFDFYDAGETQVWNRALTGILMTFFIYEERMELYTDIAAGLKLISEDRNIQKHAENIILQFARSKETERISKKLRDEIIPEMQKFQPKIQDKLKLDDILSDLKAEDKNPDWEELFEDAPGLLDKMADFSKLQLEGSDVFMSAFSMFKHFSFFNSASNWFIPYYKENSDVTDSFKGFSDTTDIERFAGGLEKSVFMCNSDKYSFCMNIKHLPEAQRGMLLELFNREIEQMKEIGEEDEKLFKDMKDKYIFTQYIQDLYRFFKLHPLRSNFRDFFNTEHNFYNRIIYQYLITDPKFLQNLGNLYFHKGFYSDAAGILELYQKEDIQNHKNLEKIGYSYQMSGNYEKAKEYYLKAEIFGTASLWLLKQLAFCFRKLRDYENALKYYLIAETHDADNMQLQAGIGHCYLSLGEYENALKRYFKVEFYAPDNIKVKKPIAWCSLIIGKFETAVKYYQKVCENTTEAYDLINYAHALYCINRKEEAVELYLRAIQVSTIDLFDKVMHEDKEILRKHLIDDSEVDTIIDIVKLNYFSLNQSI